MDHERLFDIQESPDDRQPPAWRGTASIPVVRCRRCRLVFLNPRYDNERLVALYQDPQMFIGTIDPEGRSRSIARERPERVTRFAHDVASLRKIRAGGRLLDVGCGLAFFLEALGDQYDAVGLEWSAPVVSMTRALPFTVVESRFPDHTFGDGEFDIVSFHNVLDHLPDPLTALETTRALLRVGGVLMITGVNFGSIAARIYGAGYRLLSPNHLYYFEPATLRAFLDRSGFRLSKIEYPYFGTAFARPAEHAWRMLRDWWMIDIQHSQGSRVSPPFYGNMMRVFATRVA